MGILKDPLLHRGLSLCSPSSSRQTTHPPPPSLTLLLRRSPFLASASTCPTHTTFSTPSTPSSPTSTPPFPQHCKPTSRARTYNPSSAPSSSYPHTSSSDHT